MKCKRKRRTNIHYKCERHKDHVSRRLDSKTKLMQRKTRRIIQRKSERKGKELHRKEIFFSPGIQGHITWHDKWKHKSNLHVFWSSRTYLTNIEFCCRSWLILWETWSHFWVDKHISGTTCHTKMTGHLECSHCWSCSLFLCIKIVSEWHEKLGRVMWKIPSDTWEDHH